MAFSESRGGAISYRNRTTTISAMSGSTMCMGATSEGLPSAEQFKRQRARMTLPERLCFLLDVSPEMGSPWEDGQPRIEAVKAAVRMIYRRKVNLCAGHSFAVMAFDRCGRVTPLGPFSSKASDLDSALEAVRVQPQVEAVPGDAVDLSVLVDDVQTALRADPSADSAARYIHRCVIIYCRSDEVPQYSYEPALLREPSFFVDILYLHRRGSEPGVQCQSVFDVLCEVQREVPEGADELAKTSYIIESHPSSLKYLPAVAVMAAHPVQRGELYGDDGMLSKLDPSESTIADIRSRLVAAVATPEQSSSAKKGTGGISTSKGGDDSKSTASFSKIKTWSMFSSKKS